MKTPPFALPILRTADLSTLHLTPDERKLIADPGTPGVSMCGEYGALVYLPIDGEDSDRRAAGYSDAFLRLLKIAATQGFTHLRFDDDGCVVQGLETFDDEE